jgi:hypothetical protein
LGGDLGAQSHKLLFVLVRVVAHAVGGTLRGTSRAPVASSSIGARLSTHDGAYLASDGSWMVGARLRRMTAPETAAR